MSAIHTSSISPFGKHLINRFLYRSWSFWPWIFSFCDMSRSSPTIYLGVFHVNNCICYLSSTSSSQCTRFPIGHVTNLARPHISFNNSCSRNTCIICLIHDITNLVMVMLYVVMHSCIDNQSRNFPCLIHNLVIASIIPLVICTKREKMMTRNNRPPP